jgi:hypothetical protein
VTRPAGMIIVRMRRRSALALAQTIAGYTPPPHTMLALAGFSEEKIKGDRQTVLHELESLVAALRGSHRGRPRAQSSVYNLPRNGVLRFQREIPTLIVPRELHLVARQMVRRANRDRVGRRPFVKAALAEALVRQCILDMDERNVRRLIARQRLEKKLDQQASASRRAYAADLHRIKNEIASNPVDPGISAIIAMSSRFKP